MTTAVQLAQSVAPGVSLGFKNRIINGAMVIDQRNAGASVTPTANGYVLDRWNAIATQTSKFSIQQSSTAPTGFVNSSLVTSLSAYSVISTDRFSITQYIEGLNIADLAWGTSSAASVTISFWVRSSLTGTFGGSLQNNAADRAYPFSYTISSANTWEQKSVTVAGDTTGTWLTTNGIGIRLNFSLGTGSAYTSSAGSWQAGNYRSVTGETSVVGTSGATFYITGVQLEVGTAATSFEFRDYGRELIMCQRYYQRLTANSSADLAFPAGLNPGTTSNFVTYFPCVTMRSAPTTSANTAAWGYCRNNGSFTIYATNAVPSVGSGATSSLVVFYATVASGLTSASLGLTYVLINNWIDFSSEL